MNTGFNISPDIPIYVYGAGNLGLSVCQNLIDAGYNLIGILDQKGSADIQAPVAVYRPGEEPFVENACVCICLYNGLQHTPIARQLRLRGYFKILFLPLFLSTKASKKMIEDFNSFVAGRLNTIIDIPFYDELWKINIEDHILREAGEFVTVMIPVDHVFTVKRKLDEAHPFDAYSPEVLITIPGFSHDSPLYTAADYASERLMERTDLHCFFERALFHGLEFFIDAAPPAKLNPRGYFNLLDGHHRASFLLHRGFRGIPVRVLRAEYEQYFNQEAANTLMSFCKDFDELPFAVNHPVFVKMPLKKDVSKSENQILQDFKRLCDKLTEMGTQNKDEHSNTSANR